jgi:hypothetical protein
MKKGGRMMKKIMKLGLVIAMVLSLLNVPFMAEVKALSGYENIALNKTVSANSTHSSKNIAYAVDGKVVEKQTWQVDYSTGSDYNRGNGNLVQEFIIDLGGNALINQIDLTWTKTVWAKSVKVEGSFDGVDYFLIKEVNDNTISEEMEKQMIEFDLTRTKYVKLTFNEPNNKTYGYEFYEVEVFGEMLENLALNKTVSVPSTAGNKSAAYLTDGKVVDKETWQVAYVAGSDYNRGDGNTTQSIQLDLLKECIINEMDLTWATTVWAKSIKVEGSLDGAEYFTMKEISDNVISADKERQIIALDDVKTRYIKVTFDEPNNKTYGYELYEFEVYGVEAASDRIELEPVYESIKNVSPTIAEDGETIILPSIPYEDYEVIIYGSSNESVIGCDGTIYQPLVDTTVNISYKIVNKNNPEDCFYNDYDEASIVIPGLYETEANDNEKPIVLPEIQEWKGLSGTFTLSENTKLVASDESLVDTLELVQFYFKEMLNREIEVVVGTPSSEDIYFTLSEKTELGQEGYIANIDEKVTGKHMLASHIVTYDYLWAEIRVKGGAYGNTLQVSRNGDVAFGSYRDPNVTNTYNVFNNVSNYLNNFNPSDDEFVSYIIGSLGNLDYPLSTPSMIDMWDINYINNFSKEDKVQIKQQVLNTTAKDIKELAKLFEVINEKASSYTIGNEEKIKEYNFDKIESL